MTVLDATRRITNDGSAHSPEPTSIASAGQSARGWIQAPITRVEFASLTSRPFMRNGPYASIASAFADGGARNELGEMQMSAAASFWAFEDSLPEE